MNGNQRYGTYRTELFFKHFKCILFFKHYKKYQTGLANLGFVTLQIPHNPIL